MKVENTRDYVDYMEQHELYSRLMEEYSQTEIFKEIIHFLNIAYPKWFTNHFLGSWAAEFVETAIHNLEYLRDREEHTRLEMLTNIYQEVSDSFEDSCINHDLMFSEQLINRFEFEYDDELEEYLSLNQKGYSDFYNKLFNSFEERELNKVIYNFKDELVY